MTFTAASDLRAFLREFENVVDEAWAERDALYPKELHADLKRLWDEAKASFESLDQKLKTAEEDPGGMPETLAEAGLVGPQLEAKLSPFRRAVAAFRLQLSTDGLPMDLWLDIVDALPLPRGVKRRIKTRVRRLRRQRRPGRLVRAFQSVLRWANLILGSLVKALPIGEPVKEAKEALEAAAAEMEASRAPHDSD